MIQARDHVDITNLNPDLIDKICKLEALLGYELTITSGFRAADHPVEALKKAPGAHNGDGRLGDAVDCVCLGSRDRYYLVKHALALGFNRVGIASDFIHLDVSTKRTPEVIWLY